MRVKFFDLLQVVYIPHIQTVVVIDGAYHIGEPVVGDSNAVRILDLILPLLHTLENVAHVQALQHVHAQVVRPGQTGDELQIGLLEDVHIAIRAAHEQARVLGVQAVGALRSQVSGAAQTPVLVELTQNAVGGDRIRVAGGGRRRRRLFRATGHIAEVVILVVG